MKTIQSQVWFRSRNKAYAYGFTVMIRNNFFQSLFTLYSTHFCRYVNRTAADRPCDMRIVNSQPNSFFLMWLGLKVFCHNSQNSYHHKHLKTFNSRNPSFHLSLVFLHHYYCQYLDSRRVGEIRKLTNPVSCSECDYYVSSTYCLNENYYCFPIGCFVKAGLCSPFLQVDTSLCFERKQLN